MNVEDAVKVYVGQKVLYKNGYVFTVRKVKIATPHDMERTNIMFYDNRNEAYNARDCRLWGELK